MHSLSLEIIIMMIGHPSQRFLSMQKPEIKGTSSGDYDVKQTADSQLRWSDSQGT